MKGTVRIDTTQPFYARVVGNFLSCYNWDEGDTLEITECLEYLDIEHGEFLWKAYNINKKDTGAVSSHQMEIIEGLEPLRDAMCLPLVIQSVIGRMCERTGVSKDLLGGNTSDATL